MTDEPIEVELAGASCTLITVQREHYLALLELEKLCRNPYATIGEYVTAMKKLDPWKDATVEI